MNGWGGLGIEDIVLLRAVVDNDVDGIEGEKKKRLKVERRIAHDSNGQRSHHQIAKALHHEEQHQKTPNAYKIARASMKLGSMTHVRALVSTSQHRS